MFVAAIDASRESVQISLQISEFKRVTFFSLENFWFPHYFRRNVNYVT